MPANTILSLGTAMLELQYRLAAPTRALGETFSTIRELSTKMDQIYAPIREHSISLRELSTFWASLKDRISFIWDNASVASKLVLPLTISTNKLSNFLQLGTEDIKSVETAFEITKSLSLIKKENDITIDCISRTLTQVVSPELLWVLAWQGAREYIVSSLSAIQSDQKEHIRKTDNIEEKVRKIELGMQKITEQINITVVNNIDQQDISREKKLKSIDQYSLVGNRISIWGKIFDITCLIKGVWLYQNQKEKTRMSNQNRGILFLATLVWLWGKCSDFEQLCWRFDELNQKHRKRNRGIMKNITTMESYYKYANQFLSSYNPEYRISKKYSTYEIVSL